MSALVLKAIVGTGPFEVVELELEIVNDEVVGAAVIELVEALLLVMPALLVLPLLLLTAEVVAPDVLLDEVDPPPEAEFDPELR